jgi:hypothetical protein
LKNHLASNLRFISLQVSVVQALGQAQSTGCAGIDGAGATSIKKNSPSQQQPSIMATSTPSNSPKRQEYDTTKRARFFNAFDSKENDVGLAKVCKTLDFKLPPSTARRWIKERDIQRSPAIRRTRKQASRLGRKSKVSASDIDKLTNQEDPIHKEPYEIQAKTLNSNPSARTLQAHATQAGAKRFKKRYTTKISKKNKPIRIAYGKKHEKETLTGFWQYVVFTDEAHFQSVKLQNKAEYELRFPS